MIGYEEDIFNSLEVLKKGGTILYPTDTVWGIGCDATNEEAVSRIYELKGRSIEKSMLILISDEEMLNTYTSQKHLQVYDYIKGINKPVTVIYENAKNLAGNVINSDGSIGIRIVNDDFCKQLIRNFGKPIVSTSSNVSGYPTPSIFNDIDIIIKNGVDYVVKHRQDETTPGSPSSVVKILNDGSFQIIRP
jgi:L-threonylcarbamoyladenylate synthase